MFSNVGPIPAGHAAIKFIFQQIFVHRTTDLLLGLQLCLLYGPVPGGDQPVPVGPRFPQECEATTAAHLQLFWQIEKQIRAWQKLYRNSIIDGTTNYGKFDYSCEFEHCSCSGCP
jgi:hypothetical protein